ncbi:hypothetical protein [Gluconobacter cerinus]|uniref:Uncharacterized protein n=1 Tax=Gluconobacter cerinus TaxID=38307 RepID=A0AAV5NC76_9PROT|nr:hypothetical protein [Gluconobacter cerinus]GLQ61569.1 hypothetical protein GCM10007867_04140 [Gluconobacter cerinus]
MSDYSSVMELSEEAPIKVRHWRVPVGTGFLRFPEPFNAKAVRESARVRPDLANQVRRTASGHTFSRGGAMRMPAKWGSGHE